MPAVGDDADVSVHGYCAAGFAPVRAALGEILTAGAEVGAALAVYIEGQAVVDLWGGHTRRGADARLGPRHHRQPLLHRARRSRAVCALRLVEAGRLDLDAPVARYWPEFAQAGKAGIPLRYLLTHQAALPADRPRRFPPARGATGTA